MGKKNDVPLKEKYRLWVGNKNRKQVFSLSLRLYSRGETEIQCQNYYNFFGNLSEKSFEDFWRIEKDFLERHNPGSASVAEYSEWLDHDFEYLFRRYWSKQKKQPSAIEVKEKLKARLKWPDWQCVLWVNHLTNESISSLSKKFSETIKQKRKQGISGKYYGRFPMLYPGIRYGDLKRYLEVYDHRKEGKKWREIAKIIHSKIEWNESLERALYIDFNNAKKIIKNVEGGLSPGKY